MPQNQLVMRALAPVAPPSLVSRAMKRMDPRFRSWSSNMFKGAVKAIRKDAGKKLGNSTQIANFAFFVRSNLLVGLVVSPGEQAQSLAEIVQKLKKQDPDLFVRFSVAESVFVSIFRECDCCIFS
jgi:hypothetical protein